jgi:molybdopterin-containing oxidoreductase family iron-sulfur binding subunit
MSLDEGEHGASAAAEFDSPAAEPSRRDFLRLAGFSAAGALGAACGRAPVRQAIPLVTQPAGAVPGRGQSYATTCGGCAAGCGLLVTVRDGRPIKVEGMPDHPLSAGGVCAVGQSTLLGLYDNRRFRQAMLSGQPAAWADVDRLLAGRFEAIRQTGGAVRVLTPTVHSPTVRREIAALLATFGDGAHVEYDTISASALLDAHETTHGVRALPRYFFDRADVIVSFDADFLGTWITPSQYTFGWARRRTPRAGRPPSWHAQIESRVSLTGGKADCRVSMAPDEIAALAFDVAEVVEGGHGAGLAGELGTRLLEARGRSLVISGIQDREVQQLCNHMNAALGNYGCTIDISRPSHQRRGSDRAVAGLLQDAAAGRVAALLVWHANPLFDLPGGDGLAKVPLIVSFAERADETTAVAHAICPDHHAFESWTDAEPVAGVFGLTQPVVAPLFGTRALVETLAAWRGRPRPAQEIVEEHWRAAIFPLQRAEADFDRFWIRAVQTGHVCVDPPAVVPRPASPPSIARRPAAPETTHLVLHHTPAMLGGEHAWNPFLQELPDPVTKIVWDNYASVSPALARQLQIASGDVVRLETSQGAIELPAHVQPGQHDRTIAVALGYGSLMTERFKDLGRHWFGSQPTVGPNGRVGVNAAALQALDDGTLRRHVPGVRVSRVGRRHVLAYTQEHHTLTVPARVAPPGGERRPIVQEVAFEEIGRGGAAAGHEAADLWPDDHRPAGHRWGMAVDLNACTGCGACVVACQVENNIPVVGKDEVRRNRELHWIRIDRYYSQDADGLHIAQQPMFCQHCGHAPCETVCPTLATVHSAEGLNQQVYNRCVGTRYCANNCPYKARRFNWFEYPHGEGSEALALNPDVTVRVRGVMEKCTMCVQRIQEGKIEATRRGVAVADGDIQTACQQSCAAAAIVFGDLNDPSSRVARLATDARAYRVLEELNVKPSVTYLKIVRQTASLNGGPASHG